MLRSRHLSALSARLIAAAALTLVLLLPSNLHAQSAQVLTNQVGYEDSKPKRAVLLGATQLAASSFQLIDETTGKVVYQGNIVFSGPVDKWKHWLFWTMDFSAYNKTGTYRLQFNLPQGAIASHPFIIGKNVLEKATLSDVVYYFKGQRSAGLIDQADSHLPLAADLHGTSGKPEGGFRHPGSPRRLVRCHGRLR